jgi:hypothetical protein
VHRHKHPNAVTDPMDADMPPNSLAKLVCLRSEAERVVGFHFVGGAAGEMTQVRPRRVPRAARRLARPRQRARRHPARSPPRPPALCALTERSARPQSRRRGPAPPPSAQALNGSSAAGVGLVGGRGSRWRCGWGRRRPTLTSASESTPPTSRPLCPSPSPAAPASPGSPPAAAAAASAADRRARMPRRAHARLRGPSGGAGGRGARAGPHRLGRPGPSRRRAGLEPCPLPGVARPARPARR